MNLRIIFDKFAENNQLYTGWGVSFLVDDRILFDTGEKGCWLLKNMDILKVDPEKIEAVVISHDHWDHTGGLWDLLQIKKGLTVYACPGFSREFKDRVAEYNGNLVESETFTEISPDIFVTGEIAGIYKESIIAEQSLVIKSSGKISVITGCAHPGVMNILDAVRNVFQDSEINTVLGGFHLKDRDERFIETVADGLSCSGVRKVGATHCSGDNAEAILKKMYGDNFIKIVTGHDVEV